MIDRMFDAESTSAEVRTFLAEQRASQVVSDLAVADSERQLAVGAENGARSRRMWGGIVSGIAAAALGALIGASVSWLDSLPRRAQRPSRE